jgi:hypothetical protein
MRKNGDTRDTVLWIDIFSKSFFQGRMQRLRLPSRKNKGIYDAKELSPIGSVIVGPGAVVELIRGGKSANIRLKQGTILTDTSRLTHGKRIQSIHVTSVGG